MNQERIKQLEEAEERLRWIASGRTGNLGSYVEFAQEYFLEKERDALSDAPSPPLDEHTSRQESDG